MPELTKEEAAKEAAKTELVRVAKRAVSRPKKAAAVTPKNKVGATKRGPGRPKGSGKKGPGRPKGASKKGPGRPKGSAAKAPSLKGYVKKQDAKRMVKDALKAFKTKLPALILKELKKQLR